ncbi:hypothetical protein BDQ17DRAFT_1429445 [Cyathus striatus]|nr:hypothetical protein BDQ17DRAFT_1429445 [Cyathus striatus]
MKTTRVVINDNVWQARFAYPERRNAINFVADDNTFNVITHLECLKNSYILDQISSVLNRMPNLIFLKLERKISCTNPVTSLHSCAPRITFPNVETLELRGVFEDMLEHLNAPSLSSIALDKYNVDNEVDELDSLVHFLAHSGCAINVLKLSLSQSEQWSHTEFSAVIDLAEWDKSIVQDLELLTWRGPESNFPCMFPSLEKVKFVLPGGGCITKVLSMAESRQTTEYCVQNAKLLFLTSDLSDALVVLLHRGV